MRENIITGFAFIFLLSSIMLAEVNDSAIMLAKSVLFYTHRIVSASIAEGNVIYTPEVLAFNIIYEADTSSEIFKNIYKGASAASIVRYLQCCIK